MKIKSMRVENFRAVKSQTLAFDGLTALVGPNGSGKSAFLHALLVLQGRKNATIDDFHNRNTDEDIEIAVTFTCLSAAAKKKFAKYLEDGDLEVVRVCRYNNGAVESALHGRTLRNPDFAAVRAAGLAKDTLEAYNKLRDKGGYEDLPKRAGKGAALEELDRWEDAHPDRCERSTDGGRFFGFKEVAEGYLGQFTKLLYVPAVHDASADGTEEGRGSALHDLVEIVVRKALAGSDRYKDLQEQADAVYENARNVGGLPEARRLQESISATLARFARGASVDLQWSLNTPSVGLPTATAFLKEDGYSTTIDRTGHGLQRAFIITMLAALHGAQAGASAQRGGEGGEGGEGDNDSNNDDGPSVVLAIEEPELYQHPTRARHLARLLLGIADKGLSGIARNVQVIYATHSPHFVGADRIGQVRLLRKEGGQGGPGATRVWSTDADRIRKRLADTGAGAAKNTDAGRMGHALDRILTPMMSEGFFADTVVLVEGESDRIAITRAADMLGTPLDERGAVVVPCGSKSGLAVPLVMFKQLGVRTYAVWDMDSDREEEKDRNALLLSLLGHTADPAGEGDNLQGTAGDGFFCFRERLEDALRSDLGGEAYDKIVDGRAARRRKKQDGRKPAKLTPLTAHLVMREMDKGGIRPAILGRVVGAIIGAGAAGGPAP